mmetsp:Transcript_52001/g.101832  ORF Transcript_52001/g.101832 Transcript_52001/m.101832 type:complete len:85 (+) Transcript_52001:1124-1378(+)
MYSEARNGGIKFFHLFVSSCKKVWPVFKGGDAASSSYAFLLQSFPHVRCLLEEMGSVHREKEQRSESMKRTGPNTRSLSVHPSK